MTALSMGMAAFGAHVPIGMSSQPSDPLTFNAWLEAHNGYHCEDGDCNNLVLDAVSSLNSSFLLVGEIPIANLPIETIESGLSLGQTIYLAHVSHPGCSGPCHFVLLTGVESAGSGNFTVNDPDRNVTMYVYKDIFDIIVYTVTAPVASSAALQPVVPFAYPLYKQCDAAWGFDLIGSEASVTICDVGCLMSSVSMALSRNNLTIPIPGGSSHVQTANPQSLNTWLQLNSGYEDGDDFNEDDMPALNPSHIAWNDTYGMHRTNDVSIGTVQNMVVAGQPVIANVMQGRHFVLVVGWDAANNDTLLVNDPGFDTASYSYAIDVVGWRLFNMTPA